MTSKAEVFLDCSGVGKGGDEGSTNFGHLPGFFKPCLRSSWPRTLSEADLYLSRLPLVGAGSNLDGRGACCGVPEGLSPESEEETRGGRGGRKGF